MNSFDYFVTYSMTSIIGCHEVDRFINEYVAEVFVSKASGEVLQIGRVMFKIILLEQAEEHCVDLFELFDYSEPMMDLGFKIYDFRSGRLSGDLLKACDNTDFAEKIILVEEFELLPGFRSKGLGKQIIKDIYVRFNTLNTLFFIEAIPFQLSMVEIIKSRGENGLDDFSKAMRYDDLEFDKEAAQYKLNAFFQKLGFKYYKDNYFFLESNIRQEKLLEVEW